MNRYFILVSSWSIARREIHAHVSQWTIYRVLLGGSNTACAILQETNGYHLEWDYRGGRKGYDRELSQSDSTRLQANQAGGHD
jgi:hypothetical protein